jgi:hypothetical protein
MGPIKSFLFFAFFLAFPLVAQASTEKIKDCLNSLYADQIEFHKRSGRYAAHVDQLHNSEREACYGMVLRLSRKTGQDFHISAEMGGEVWTITQEKKLFSGKSK